VCVCVGVCACVCVCVCVCVYVCVWLQICVHVCEKKKAARMILPGTFRELDEVCSEVREDSQVLRVHLLWFPTSDRLQTWLIPSETTQS